MRLRKVELDFGSGRVVVDTRGEGNFPYPVVSIVGNNGSGKSLLMSVVMRVFSATSMDRSDIKLFNKNVNAVVEYESNQEINVAVVDSGVLVQKPRSNSMRYEDSRLTNGCLYYDQAVLTDGMVMGDSVVKTAITRVCEDLYTREIKNCLIMIDNFDLGMDRNNLSLYSKSIVKKAMERDNQLLVSTINASSTELLGMGLVRQMGAGADIYTSVIERIGKS